MFSHFLDAQAPVYETALAELQAGRKRTHWMWFVFPQIAGLGSSPMAQRYALTGLDAARVYLGDPVLGSRLCETTEAVLAHAGTLTVGEIFGHPDDLKFHSAMTLFHRAAPEDPLFARALAAFWGGHEDSGTIERL